MESVSTRRQRIVLAARKNRHEPLTALNHHMDLNWMAEAYRGVRKNATPGIDGQTVAEYGENLVENLRDLQERAKSGPRAGATERPRSCGRMSPRMRRKIDRSEYQPPRTRSSRGRLR